jgi:hypothetical protein
VTPSRIFKRGLIVAGVLALGLLTLAAIVVGPGRGRVIRSDYVPNHGGDFDFSNPPCEPTTEIVGAGVRIRYLGVSGVQIEWKGVALLTPPLFSRFGLTDVALGREGRWDLEEIRRGMGDPGRSGVRIRAVLVGHSHYDHLFDLPPILREYAPDAAVLVNPSGRRMLKGCEGVDNTFESLGDRWYRLEDDRGRPLPVRVLALPLDHAPVAGLYRFAPGTVSEDWNWVEGRPLSAMKQGRAYAYLVDLLNDDGSIAFRIHYQDTASTPPLGFPPDRVIEGRHVDLAVVCLASSWEAAGYPERLLRRTSARHVLVTHYEDFFRGTDEPLRFVPLLTNGRADAFMARLDAVMRRSGARPTGPVSQVCGPSGPGWTVALPGEWLRFAVDGEADAQEQ